MMMWTVHADMALAKARVVNRVGEFKDMMKTNSVTMCLTDRANFRRVLNPDYKANRSKSQSTYYLTPDKTMDNGRVRRTDVGKPRS